MGKKILVAFFSASGVTKKLAQDLSAVANADLYEIKPIAPYTKADLDWTNKKARCTVEMSDLSYRPKVADKNAKIDAYDVIFVGFPIWWGIAPTIINTFLESYDFSGKTIIPFATSGGSGLGSTAEKLRPSVSKSAVIKEGKLLNGNPSNAELKAWIHTLGLC